MALASRFGGYGYRRITALLRQESVAVNELFAFIDEGLRTEYDDAIEWYPYDSEEKALVGKLVGQLRHRRRRRVRAADNAEDALEALYEERLRGMRAPRSPLIYRWLRKAVLRVAKAARGQPLTLGALFALPDLLGLALTDERNPDGARISKSTLAHRRTAMRSVATLLYVELAAALGRAPHAVLDQALRGAAERVGGGFRIAGGSPRRHGGPAPGMAESTAIIEAVGEPQGWLGLRNRAFFTILAATGLRVNALRAISLNACFERPDGSVRLLAAEKNRPEAHEVELGSEAVSALGAYLDAYNRWAADCGTVPLILGGEGSLWRTLRGAGWGEKDLRRVLRSACQASGVADYHATRLPALLGDRGRAEASAVGGGPRGRLARHRSLRSALRGRPRRRAARQADARASRAGVSAE